MNSNSYFVRPLLLNSYFLILTFSALAAVDAADQVNAREAFARLHTLVGEWEGKTEAGRVLKVSYRLVANNTVLVETWTLGPQREALTLYHMDKDSLIATHYCPLGNQPRLRLKLPARSADRTDSSRGELGLTFEFVSATNLPKPEMAHQHRFEIEILNANSFARSETYMENGAAEMERVVYSRTGRPSS